jgi:hypothetical protein
MDDEKLIDPGSSDQAQQHNSRQQMRHHPYQFSTQSMTTQVLRISVANQALSTIQSPSSASPQSEVSRLMQMFSVTSPPIDQCLALQEQIRAQSLVIAQQSLVIAQQQEQIQFLIWQQARQMLPSDVASQQMLMNSTAVASQEVKFFIVLNINLLIIFFSQASNSTVE